jgi:uncharacterized C2H2 Zn-finger protein
MLKCEQCGKEMKNDFAMKIHVGRMHTGAKKVDAAPKKVDRPAKSAKGALVCSTCGRSFKLAAHLARHVSASHGKALTALKARKVGRPAGRRAAVAAAPIGLDVQAMTVDQLLEVKQQVDARLSGLVRQLQAAKVKI